MRMQYKTIGEINHYASENVNPARFPEQYFELYSVPHFSEGHPEIIKGKDVGATKQVVQEGDVLICKINPRINRVWKVTRHTDYPLIASSEWVIVRNADLNADYLTYYFSSPKFRVLINSELTGMGGSLIRAQPKQIRRYSVPVPDKEEQHFVVRNLALLDHLISLRQQQAEKLDELVKARFVDMFWGAYSEVIAEDVCEKIVDCPHSTPKYNESELKYPAIRTSEIQDGQIEWSSMKYVGINEYQRRVKRLIPEAGDIVYAREGTYGDCVILPEGYQFCLGQRTMLFRPNYKLCNSEYLHAVLRSAAVKYQADMSNAGSTVPHVNVSDAKRFHFPLPPLPLQNAFATFVHEVDCEKERIQRSAALLKTLKRSLMQQYFG